MKSNILTSADLKRKYSWSVDRIGLSRPPVADSIVGIAFLLQVREFFSKALSAFDKHPADIFALGTSVNAPSYHTRIGGELSFPISSKEIIAKLSSSVFIGQLYFGDSLDLLPPLPGDVVLIFFRGDLLSIDSSSADRFELVWVDSKDASNGGKSLDDVQVLPFAASGKRIRSNDYVQVLGRNTVIDAFCRGPHASFNSRFYRDSEDDGYIDDYCYLCSRAYAWKIGGLPFQKPQGQPKDGDRIFLASWVSIGTGALEEYAPLSPSETDAVESCQLMAFGGFVLNIFMETATSRMIPEIVFPVCE